VVATECALERPLDIEATRGALAALVIAGRFQLVADDPPTVVDGAHNPQAAAVLADAVAEAWPDPSRRPLVVLGMLADKDAAGVVAALAPVAEGFLVTAPDAGRALRADQLASVVEEVTGVRPPTAANVGAAIAQARQRASHGVLVTGSLYTVGEALVALAAAPSSDQC